jgi:hypothetical protein
VTPDVVARDRALFGRVRSVHRAAIYVDLERFDGLMVVAIEDVGGTPGGILVRGSLDLRQTRIQPGMAFRPANGGWSVPSAGVSITFDPSRTTTWSPALPPAATVTTTAGLGERVAAALRIAARTAPEGGFGPLLSGRDRPGDPWLLRARTVIDLQLEALRCGDMSGAVAATGDLIGLGVGLTPSGDDYLVGLLGGLEASAHPAWPALAATIAAEAPHRTTAIGASILAHAARGAYAERLTDVIVAIAGGPSDDLALTIERALAYGATSGADTLVGLFAAFEIALARNAVATRSAA